MNEFSEKLKLHAAKVKQIQPNIQTEEATKMSMVVPFFQILGYNVFDPTEFCPEFVADIHVKKGFKVDYAILENGKPNIIIECKWCGTALLEKHITQIYHYFAPTTAKFAILTNGIVYRFYTDLELANVMDQTPFMEIDLYDLKDHEIAELWKFCKANYDRDKIFDSAEELKYTTLMKNILEDEFESPSGDFVKYMLNAAEAELDVAKSVKTQKIIEKFRPLVKKSLTGFINDLVNQRISAALQTPAAPTEKSVTEESSATTENEITTICADESSTEPQSRIVTTEKEIEAFYIIRGILAGTVDVTDIVHRDTESYFGILYKDSNRKPICRLNFDTKKDQLMIPDENKNFTRYILESMNDLYAYKDQLIEVVKRYANPQ